MALIVRRLKLRIASVKLFRLLRTVTGIFHSIYVFLFLSLNQRVERIGQSAWVIKPFFFASLMLALSTACLSAKNRPAVWSTAMLVDSNVQSRQIILGTSDQILTGYRNVWTYSLDAGDKIFVARYNHRNRIPLTVGESVEFAVSDDDLYIQAAGKTFKLRVIKESLKSRPH